MLPIKKPLFFRRVFYQVLALTLVVLIALVSQLRFYPVQVNVGLLLVGIVYSVVVVLCHPPQAAEPVPAAAKNNRKVFDSKSVLLGLWLLMMFVNYVAALVMSMCGGVLYMILILIWEKTHKRLLLE